MLVQGTRAERKEGMKGHWRAARHDVGALTNEERDALLERIQAIGYLGGYEKPAGFDNVTVYVPELAYPGVNLYTSGHAEIAYLIDMEGNVLHQWEYSFGTAFPDYRKNTGLPEPDHWRRVQLLSGGELLAIYDGVGMIKLDRNSNLLWKSDRGFHHDVFVDDKGTIYALTREARVIPRIDEFEPVLEDFIAVIAPDGTMIRRVSLLEAFERSSYASLLRKAHPYGDIFHTNTIEVLDGRHADRSSVFAAGNVLISVRELDVIAIVDLSEEVVIWALTGQWAAQHQPTLLANGNILLFDNKGHHGLSKVIEIDPLTQEIVWAYEGTEENGFSSSSLGSNQRLPNGNTLITESNGGRAFEVTPDGEVVWEFYNPARAGEHNELIGALYEVVRLEPNISLEWASSAGADPDQP
jgi:hypothetical protein